MRNVGDEVDSVIRVGYACGGVGVHDLGGGGGGYYARFK